MIWNLRFKKYDLRLLKICDFRFVIRYLDFGIWNLVFGIWNLEFGIWNLVFGIYKQPAPLSFHNKFPGNTTLTKTYP
jgi:hypothetical protein